MEHGTYLKVSIPLTKVLMDLIDFSGEAIYHPELAQFSSSVGFEGTLSQKLKATAIYRCWFFSISLQVLNHSKSPLSPSGCTTGMHRHSLHHGLSLVLA